jgi:O-antigen/teichoic acid export membrane protein
VPQRPTNAQTVARNSFWFGIEIVSSIAAATVISILVARIIGPARLGSYNYVMLMTNITAGIGSSGLAQTTRKFMAEYLNQGEKGIARCIYEAALKIQVVIAASAVALGIGVVMLLGDPANRLVSSLLVLSIFPRLMVAIPSQANNAAEAMKRNTGPALVGSSVTIGTTAASLMLGWDLIGLSSALLAGSMTELAIKYTAVRSWLGDVPRQPISPDLRKRMVTFSGQGVVLMLLNIVVWDRSDLIVLRWMNSDIRQVTFFATSFGLVERLALLPETALGSALGNTIMARFGADKDSVKRVAMVGTKYGLLLAVPLLVGMACISDPFIRLAYGTAYLPMIPVLTVSCLMVLPRMLKNGATPLLQTAERQSYLIWFGCIFGALDIGLDFLLTPHYGALGAAVSNGIAQVAASLATVFYAWRHFKLDLRLGEFARIFVAGLGMGAAAFGVTRVTSGLPGLLTAILTGAIAWPLFLRLTGSITAEDRDRLQSLIATLPAVARPAAWRCLNLMSRSASG